MSVKLPQNHFNTVVRWIKRANLDQLTQLESILTSALQRLRRRRRGKMLVQGIPEGSDHYDSGSFQDWIKKVQPTDGDAITQVLILDATVQNRLAG